MYICIYIYIYIHVVSEMMTHYEHGDFGVACIFANNPTWRFPEMRASPKNHPFIIYTWIFHIFPCCYQPAGDPLIETRCVTEILRIGRAWQLASVLWCLAAQMERWTAHLNGRKKKSRVINTYVCRQYVYIYNCIYTYDICIYLYVSIYNYIYTCIYTHIYILLHTIYPPYVSKVKRWLMIPIAGREPHVELRSVFHRRCVYIVEHHHEAECSLAPRCPKTVRDWECSETVNGSWVVLFRW